MPTSFDAHWIDVSLPLGPDTPIYPGDPKLHLTTVSSHAETPYHVSHIAMGSHTGTHLDAPFHFVPDGRPFDEIPLARLNGPAWVLHLPPAATIEPALLEAAWPADAAIERLLLRTQANSAAWDTPRAGPNHQPLEPAAAEWLVARGIKLVGVDALSIEADTTGRFPVHLALLGADVVLLEGLDLRQAPAGPCELYCLPLKLALPDGGPARALIRPLGA